MTPVIGVDRHPLEQNGEQRGVGDDEQLLAFAAPEQQAGAGERRYSTQGEIEQPTEPAGVEEH